MTKRPPILGPDQQTNNSHEFVKSGGRRLGAGLFAGYDIAIGPGRTPFQPRQGSERSRRVSGRMDASGAGALPPGLPSEQEQWSVSATCRVRLPLTVGRSVSILAPSSPEHSYRRQTAATRRLLGSSNIGLRHATYGPEVARYVRRESSSEDTSSRCMFMALRHSS